MKIIKLNENKEKITYGIYDMYLNQQKAKKYREEQVKNLNFYRLIAHSLKDIEKFKKGIDRDMGEERLRTIFGVTVGVDTFKLSKKEVDFNDEVKFSSFSKGVKLYPYSECSKLSERDSQTQKRIIEQYIVNGFEHYSLNTNWGISFHNKLYLFPELFKIDKRYYHHEYNDEMYYNGDYNNGFCDNVVALSNEMAAMYFLQRLKDDYNLQQYEEYLSFCINSINLESRDSFMENVQFVKKATITKQAMDTLANMGLVSDHKLELKISRDKVYTPYIKK